MPNRPYRTSVAGIAVAVGLTASPLAAQEADGTADLLAAYPEIAGIEDRSCLGPLADYEARQGDGALAAVLQGETTAADAPEADADLIRCLQAAVRAGETGAAPDSAADATGATTEAAPEGADQGDTESGPAATAEAPESTEAPATEAAEPPAPEAAEALPAEEQAPDEDVTAEAGADARETADVEADPEAPAAAETDTSAADMPEPDAPEAAAPADDEADVETEAGVQAEVEADGGAEAADAAVQADADTAAPGEQDDGEAALRAALEAEEVDAAGTAATTDAAAADGAVAKDDDAVPADTDAVAADATPEAADSEPAPEAVQEDTEAATAAANEPVTVEAAAADGADEAEDVETVVVTEETARTSAEEFDAPAEAETAAPGSAQEAADDDIRFGQVAAGVLGGLILNEVLGADETVVANTGDRVVVERGDGDYYVLKDDNTLLRRPGTEVETRRFSDGSTRETVTRDDGTRVVTIRAPNGQVVRRERILPDGQRVVLFDDTERVAPVDPDTLPEMRTAYVEVSEDMDTEALRRALALEETRFADRRFSLRQVRDIRAVRNLVPTLQLESINFETDSAAIRPSQAEELAAIGRAMRRMIKENPYEVFLIEGHTDAVGAAAYNLALSDRRAESVALALTEYFDVPPENMVFQGYGESDLRVPTGAAERANRRAAVRRITPLLNIARRP